MQMRFESIVRFAHLRKIFVSLTHADNAGVCADTWFKRRSVIWIGVPIEAWHYICAGSGGGFRPVLAIVSSPSPDSQLAIVFLFPTIYG